MFIYYHFVCYYQGKAWLSPKVDLFCLWFLAYTIFFSQNDCLEILLLSSGVSESMAFCSRSSKFRYLFCLHSRLLLFLALRYCIVKKSTLNSWLWSISRWHNRDKTFSTHIVASILDSTNFLLFSKYFIRTFIYFKFGVKLLWLLFIFVFLLSYSG